MPLYEYECSACGNRFELIQKFSDAPPEACPKCGKKDVQKLLSSPAIQFKGTGWYITDYAKKGGGATTDDGAKPAAKDKAADTKSSPSDSSSSASSSGSTDATPAAPASKQS